MRTIELVDGVDLANAATHYSQIINLEKLGGIKLLDDLATTTHACLPVAIQAYHAASGSGTITLTLEGSLDGANWESGTALLSSIASDGAHDHASKVVDFYPLYRLKCTEDGTNDCTGLHVWVAFP